MYDRATEQVKTYPTGEQRPLSQSIQILLATAAMIMCLGIDCSVSTLKACHKISYEH